MMFYKCFTMFYDVGTGETIDNRRIGDHMIAIAALEMGKNYGILIFDPMLHSILTGVSNNSVPGREFPDGHTMLPCTGWLAGHRLQCQK